ncbi:MAG: metallophosphoesterase [Synergistaceae bacterium]|nr:metallophosphoesterase [Synergistaceae bacterium]
MRLLLSGDWHVGATTWGADRSDEIEGALEAVVSEAARRGPEAVLLLGDLFDRFRYPGDGPVHLVASTLRRLLDLSQSPHVVLLRGNHDWSGVKVWEVLSGEERLHVVDSPGLVEIGDAQFLCLPYLRPHQVPPGGLEELLSPHIARFREGLWHFLLAHQALEGTVPGLREVTVPPVLFREACHALFCGHIHRHGQVFDDPPAFYVGAPYRVDFSQEGGEVGLLWVDEGMVQSVPLQARELTTLAYADEEIALATLEEDLSRQNGAWIRVALDRASLSRAKLLERFRDLPGGGAIVQLRLGAAEELVLHDDGDPLVVEELWSRFVESEESEGPRREMLIAAGRALLEGRDPAEVWQLLLNRHLPAGEGP